MFKRKLSNFVRNITSNIPLVIENNDIIATASEIPALSNTTPEDLVNVGIFDEANGIYDASDSLYIYKKCLSAFILDIPAFEKIEILKWLSASIINLNDDEFFLLSSWCKDAYKPLCKQLKTGINNPSSSVEIANIFRWGNGFVRRDIHLTRHFLEKHYPLVDVTSNPSKFPTHVIYAYANMLSYYYMGNSENPHEQKHYAQLSLNILHYLLRFETMVKNRANYYLSLAYKILGDIDNALRHIINALNSEHSLPFQKSLLINILFSSLPNEQLPTNLEKLLIIDGRVLNYTFWTNLAEKIEDNVIRNEIHHYASLLQANDNMNVNSDLSNQDLDRLIDYLSVFTIQKDCYNKNYIERTLHYATTEETPTLAKHILFRRLSHTFIHDNTPLALYYASMSLLCKYDNDMAVLIQCMLADEDGKCVSDAISFCQNAGRDLAIINTAASLNNAMWIDGDPSKEALILEYIIANSRIPNAINLAKIRVAFLYIKGECSPNKGLAIQNFRKADVHLNSLCVEGIEDLKNKIREHGFYRHQRSLIQQSENGEFVFIEKAESDKLLIVFSCRFIYHVFQSGPMFVKGLETNALFINNPESNWYSDKEEERVSRLIEQYGLSRFKKENIVCHNASMGGYAALKFAIKHKLFCISSNPQFNIHFWSYARAADAERILRCEKIVNLDKIAINEINGLNCCIIIGRHPHDVLPFQSWLDHALKASNFTYVIIKHDIAEHASLMFKAYGDSFMQKLYEQFYLLKDLQSANDKLKPCNFADVINLQREINESYSGKWIIQRKERNYLISKSI